MGKQIFKQVSESKRDEMLEKMRNSDTPIYAEKVYILLLTGEDEKGLYKNYEIIEGRKEAFEFIKNLLQAYNEEAIGYLDIENSKVLIDGNGMRLEEAANIRDFMKYVSDKLDIPFDVDDYDKIK